MCCLTGIKMLLCHPVTLSLCFIFEQRRTAEPGTRKPMNIRCSPQLLESYQDHCTSKHLKISPLPFTHTTFQLPLCKKLQMGKTVITVIVIFVGGIGYIQHVPVGNRLCTPNYVHKSDGVHVHAFFPQALFTRDQRHQGPRVI